MEKGDRKHHEADKPNKKQRQVGVEGRDGPGEDLVERERERVQFPFPFPFLGFRSCVRYYRSRTRSFSVPVSVPGILDFFLERVWN